MSKIKTKANRLKRLATKRLFYLFTAILFPFLIGGCGEKEEDFYTQAIVTLQVPDTIVPLKIQGTIVLKNLSNGQRYTISTFSATTTTIDLLRGAYMLDAEGTLLCRMPNGIEIVKHYRASENYLEIVEHPTPVNTDIIFI